MSLVFADPANNVYDFPGKKPVFRTGNRFTAVDPDELIPLPFGSYLFSLVDRYPVYYDGNAGDYAVMRHDDSGTEAQGVSSFLASGYLRTYLPAYHAQDDARPLPLWAYAGVVFMDDGFYVPALRIDDDPRSDPGIHQDEKALNIAIARMRTRYRQNRLVRQLSTCATEYNCLCARNFFLGRHEAPVPSSPACNAGCLGCLSHQDTDAGFEASQMRLDFKPTPEEIAQVIIHHITSVDNSVVSFGQGCEGEPLLRGSDLARAVSMVREQSSAGTININTNGSKPDMVRELARAGLDSIRISLNSPTEKYYTRYHRPGGYSFDDVLRSIETALGLGLFVSINLFFMPGFTDMETEVEALREFLARFPVNMIQTRNLNIDPDIYFQSIGFEESGPIGIRNLIEMLKRDYPEVRLGYYNPPLPAGRD